MDWVLTPGGTYGGFTPNVMISAQSGYLGTGSILPCSQFPILTGDVNSVGSTCATTVVKVNGASLPSSAAVVGTNSSAQIIATTQALLNSIGYAAGGGTANAQTVTLAPAIASYTVGLSVCWLPTANNTTSTPTLNVNGKGAVTIIKAGSNPLAGSDITTTAIACAIYDGTSFELQNPQTLSGGGGGGPSPVPTPVVFYQGGTGLTAGTVFYGVASAACTITGWKIQADNGTATIKVWKIASGSTNPTSANSINTSGVSLSSGNFVSSSTLTDFTTTTVSSGDLFGFDLFAVSGATQVIFTLPCS